MRYRKIEQELRKWTEQPDSPCICESLEYSGYADLLKDILTVCVLSAKLDLVYPLLRIIAMSSSPGIYFSYFASIGPRTLQHILGFLLDQICEDQEHSTDAASMQIEMRKRRNTALLASIASQGSLTGAVLYAIIDRVAMAGKLFLDVAAEIFTVILRKGVEYSAVSKFVEKAVFDVAEFSTTLEATSESASTVAPYSSLLYKTSSISSSWLLSGVTLDELKYFSDCAIQTIEVIIKGGRSLDKAGGEDMRLQCRVLVAICCGLRLGSADSNSLLGSMCQRCLQWRNCLSDDATAESRCAVLRLQIVFLGYIYALPISDRLDYNISLSSSLSAVILQHFECCDQSAIDRDIWFSFFLRAALSLKDGESFCRLLLEEIGCNITASWTAARSAPAAVVVSLGAGKCGIVIAALQSAPAAATSAIIQEPEIFPKVYIYICLCLDRTHIPCYHLFRSIVAFLRHRRRILAPLIASPGTRCGLWNCS